MALINKYKKKFVQHISARSIYKYNGENDATTIETKKKKYIYKMKQNESNESLF